MGRAAQQPVAGDGGRVGRWYAGALGVRPPRLNRGVGRTLFAEVGMIVSRSTALCCVIGAVLCSASLARATPQAPDLLLMNGKQYSILTNPLEPFLALNPDKRPTSDIVSTGLWRGYVATWKIEDDHLILTKIET